MHCTFDYPYANRKNQALFFHGTGSKPWSSRFYPFPVDIPHTVKEIYDLHMKFAVRLEVDYCTSVLPLCRAVLEEGFVELA